MKTLAPLLLTVASLSACYDDREVVVAPGPPPVTQVWDTRFDGVALDAFGWPVADISEPVYLYVHPQGGNKYTLTFEGVLPFLVLDAVYGEALGWLDLPLAYFDYSIGDFRPEGGPFGGGTLRVWGKTSVNFYDLGWTDVELAFDLRVNSPFLESADFGELRWEAALKSEGTAYFPYPGFAWSSGAQTAAYRVD